MDTATFLEKVLGRDGYICIAAINPDPPYIKQYFFETISEAVEKAEILKHSKNIFFATGRLEKRGNREQSNVKEVRSFYVDLDCGEGSKKPKPYRNKKEAITSLKKFVKESGVPRPTVVDSGNGIHAYWPLAGPMNPLEWRSWAKRFRELCQQHNFAIDAGVTVDSARILRLPGTLNFKGEPKPCKIIQPGEGDFYNFKEILEYPDEPPQIKGLDGANFKNTNPTMQRLAGNIQCRFKKILAKTAKGKGCAQLAHIIANQDTMEEPLWRAGLSIAKFCVDGDQAAHKISRKHPEYDYDFTEKKLSEIKGPYTCDKFDQYRPGVCENCKFRGKIKSPIVLGRDLTTEEKEEIHFIDDEGAAISVTAPKVELPEKYPRGYARGVKGGVYRKAKSEEEDPELIYSNDLYVIRRIMDPILGETVMVRLHLPHDKPREFMLPLSSISASDRFRDEMSKNGVLLMDYNKLRHYATAWVNELQAKGQADNAARQYGWVDNDMKEFVLGNRIIKADSIEPNYPTSPTARSMAAYSQKGSYEEWKKAIAFYNKPTMQIFQYMMARSFGSILMPFLPMMHASGMHLFSKTGHGKTTGLYAAMSVWGEPELLVPTAKDTLNSLFHQCEIRKNLPLVIDEYSNEKAENISELILNITSGQQKARLTRNAEEQYRGNPWSFLWFTTSNFGFIDTLSSKKKEATAEFARFFEVRMALFTDNIKMETDLFRNKLKQNYGHAGWRFVQYVIQNRDSVAKLLFETQRKMDTLFNLSQEERYWSADIACTLTAGIICKRLEILPFELDSYIQLARKLVTVNRQDSKSVQKSAIEVVTDFVYDNYSNFIIIHDSAIRNNPLGFGRHTEFDAKIKLYGRYEQRSKKLYLIKSVFKEWCANQQIPYSAIEQELKQKHSAISTRKRVSAGSKIPMPPAQCLALRMAIEKDS